MSAWAFRDYFPETGGCPIRDWYAAQDAVVQSAFDTTVRVLEATEDWTDRRVKEFKVLTGPHAGLAEILFDVEVRSMPTRKITKRKFRPVGIFRESKRDFIFLLGCEKSGRIYVPDRAFDMALTLKSAFERGLGATDDHI